MIIAGCFQPSLLGERSRVERFEKHAVCSEKEHA
jgi:hypothetical protein